MDSNNSELIGRSKNDRGKGKNREIERNKSDEVFERISKRNLIIIKKNEIEENDAAMIACIDVGEI